jgi:serine/threonine protein kinase
MEKMAHAGHPQDESEQGRASNQSLPTALDETKPGDEVSPAHCKWDLRHFKNLNIIGRGNYATVYLVESLQTHQLYAMKVRGKQLLYENSEIDSISTEKAVLLLARKEKHPFVVEVFGGSQTPSEIMFFLEFCQGGDLMSHLQAGELFDMKRVRYFLTIAKFWNHSELIVGSRFYAAEITLALKWFHDMHLLHRNLTLNDILLGLDGHIKIADFVVSKLDLQPGSKTATFCGSVEFMAPEVSAMTSDEPHFLWGPLLNAD